MEPRTLANIRVVWQCDQCGKQGHVDVHGKLQWAAVMDAVYSDHGRISPECGHDHSHIHTTFEPIDDAH